tara:strand:+ start:1370 stop:2803 length:1434 start_codon:yes stop_codon:yes gene_type:complete
MHTVEKIGGTSMSRHEDVLNNIFIGGRQERDLYNRIFVVSAYGGITDKLLEHKKNRKPGVYALFSDGDSEWAWGDALTRVSHIMCEKNKKIFGDSEEQRQADSFVIERIEGVRSCLMDLHRLCSFGHFQLEEHLMTVREMLSALGEAHSAYNTSLLLQKHGVNARFIDLSGWREMSKQPLDEKLMAHMKDVDLTRELPIVTGYAQCSEGLMNTYDRGYTEITFSRLAVLTGAREAIIHKEYHLSSADPKIVGVEKVKPIGQTNYDVADQLSNLGMEAIHPRAAKGLRQSGIPLRVKNTFEPDHDGTLIRTEYVSEKPCVEIVAGRKGIYGIEVFDQDMVGVGGYEETILKTLKRFKVKMITKDINANTVTTYVAGNLKDVRRVVTTLEEEYPQSEISVHKVSIVSAIGSDMQISGLLSRAVRAMAEHRIVIRAMSQSIRQVDIQFIVAEDDYEAAIRALHEVLVEKDAEQGIMTDAA